MLLELGLTSSSSFFLLIVIHPNVNDRLTFDLHLNGQKYTIDLTLNAGHYTSTSMIQEINSSLQEKLTNLGFFPDLVQAQIGGITSGTTEDDSDKLVFKINMQENGRNDSGTYRIDGVRGNAAYTLFYQAEGELYLASKKCMIWHLKLYATCQILLSM